MANDNNSKKSKNPLLVDIGIRIQRYRYAKDLSQEQLAEIIEVTTKHLSRVENGYHDLKFTTIIKIANALNIPVDALVTDMVDDDISVFLKSIQPDIEKLSPKQKEFVKNMIKQLSEIDD